ncbi:hypothetical protein I5M32_01045 [Pedobacter sp. SD-b]|uniref:Uncharacterized protein n=1 Tax=Pedobacter segetis TaxID=2793069 RepID=A0ABS1BF82_9SPHI|nr:hypothetical protein [Pedobacter segetis]MBK0381532.1 hypothetical protein [Pedobacter segetis]
MKKLITLLLVCFAVSAFAQKQVKDLKYYYYYANQDKDFNAYLAARKSFDNKKFDFKLPASKEAVAELQTNESKIFKNERTYAEFLKRYGMKNAGDYAKLWFNQMETLKVFIKKNPEFYSLSPKERQNVIDKWYFSEIAAN